jgi:hypothetical protein
MPRLVEYGPDGVEGPNIVRRDLVGWTSRTQNRIAAGTWTTVQVPVSGIEMAHLSLYLNPRRPLSLVSVSSACRVRRGGGAGADGRRSLLVLRICGGGYLRWREEKR